MSKHINVNPDHYKVGGREHQGEEIHHEQNKRELAMQQKALERQRRRNAEQQAAQPPAERETEKDAE